MACCSIRLCITVLIVLIFKAKICWSVQWEKVHCSSDPKQSMPEGIESNIGRFPWLGVVQHSFRLGNQSKFAITGGILIHPAFAIAAAEDIAKIPPESITNNTKFVIWNSESVKYSMDVIDYALHSEYDEKTIATVALLELFTHGETVSGPNPAPVLPACLPVMGAGSYSALYTAKMTDESGELEKQVFSMYYVTKKDCQGFYEKAELDYKKMTPTYSLCAVSQTMKEPCVWDSGAALITRQSWGHWTLLGFGLRGPGCGAPARFLNIHSYLPWIDDMITRPPTPEEEENDTVGFGFRRLSPYELIMYKAHHKVPTEYGQCERGIRGTVHFKDSTEVLVNKDFAQGFYFVSVAQVAQFTCALVKMETTSRTNTGVWIEHHCYRDVTGDRPGYDYTRLECFVYFKSVAFIEFRFFFSFKAIIEVTLYGNEEFVRELPDPFKKETTDAWWPTARNIRWGSFYPIYVWWYFL